MKKKIIEYLEGPRNHAEGVALVLEFSKNASLKHILSRRGENSRFAGHVIEELRKLAGLSIKELQTMKRKAKASPESVAVADSKQNQRFLDLQDEVENLRDQVSELEGQVDGLNDELEEEKQRPKPVSDTLQKMINFRTRFPFLNDPNCPDILKILVADMFTAYGKYRSNHAMLVEVPADTFAPELTKSVLDNYLEDRRIMAELEYYRDNGTLLGEHPKVAVIVEQLSLKDMSDFDLSRALKNAMSNISKANVQMADPAKAESAKARLEKWQTKKAAIEAEIKKRSGKN